MSQENVEVIRRWLDAYNSRDARTVAALLHPEVEWHSIAGRVSGTEAIRGRDAVVGFLFDDLLGGLPDFQVTTQEISELRRDRVLLIARYEGRGDASGAAVTMDAAAIYRLNTGVIVCFQDFASRAEALKAVGLEE